MAKREEYLAKHPYKIWRSKDGKWYTYLPDGEKGRVLKKRSSEKRIEDDIIEYWKEQTENPTIEEIFNEYNDRRLELQQIAPSTHWRNQQCFNRHYDEFGKRKIRSVSAEEFSDFLEEQVPRFNLKAKAFNNLKCITRGMLKRAKKNKFIEFNVSDVFDAVEVPKNSFNRCTKEDCQEVFNDEEMDLIINYLIQNQSLSGLGILLLFATGMRIGELVALKWCDFSEDTVKVRRTETCYLDSSGKWRHEVKDFPKTNAGVRNIVIPMDFRWLYNSIRQYSSSEEFVFYQNGRRMSESGFRHKLERLCIKFGIVKKSPHKIRKTYGTILLDNNVDERLVTDQMGHATISITEGYYHKTRRNAETKTRIISDIPEFQLNTAKSNQKVTKSNQADIEKTLNLQAL
ncbi:MAG: site-specific integrase [Clostridiales bacterium]|nr:site-specific integrase [Clostridiales bacterium]